MRLSGRWDEFRRLGGHFVLALGKTNLSRPLAICNELTLPAYVVFDGDGPHEDDTPKARENKTRNERDNRCLLALADCHEANPLADSTVRSTRITMWPKTLVEAVKADVGAEVWQSTADKVRDELGLHGVSEKNGLLLAAIFEAVWQSGARSASLAQLCDDILCCGARVPTFTAPLA